MADPWGGSWGTSWGAAWGGGGGSPPPSSGDDAWGGSWGTSWGFSWGAQGAPDPDPEVPAEQPAGRSRRRLVRNIFRTRYQGEEHLFETMDEVRAFLDSIPSDRARRNKKRPIARIEVEKPEARDDEPLVQPVQFDGDVAGTLKRIEEIVSRYDMARTRKRIEDQDEDESVAALLTFI